MQLTPFSGSAVMPLCALAKGGQYCCTYGVPDLVFPHSIRENTKRLNQCINVSIYRLYQYIKLTLCPSAGYPVQRTPICHWKKFRRGRPERGWTSTGYNYRTLHALPQKTEMISQLLRLGDTHRGYLEHENIECLVEAVSKTRLQSTSYTRISLHN